MVRREEVRNALQEVDLGDVFNGQAMGGTHRQLGGLLQLLSSPGRVDFDMSNDDARLLEESEMRRVFGKCVLGLGSKGVNRQWSGKRAQAARARAGRVRSTTVCASVRGGDAIAGSRAKLQGLSTATVLQAVEGSVECERPSQGSCAGGAQAGQRVCPVRCCGGSQKEHHEQPRAVYRRR